ncbi:nuclease-related domain-containing protein [Arcobacter sp. YIC-464]|uniref:nuclease-related domain-containing protein n=1 Tax=Arcobacter sp. YIC-464 TaxID=3376631 RepID=UPI003C26E7F2
MISVEFIILFILIVIIGFIFKSPIVKGIIGEKSVYIVLNNLLNKEKYFIMQDITLEKKDDTTQIDLIVFSIYGIFVIEVKNYKGWIFGNTNQKTWTQSIYKKKNKFQNPLYQNYKHIKFLEETLNISMNNIFKNVVVFTGDSKFKTKLPNNICTIPNLVLYIQSFNKPILSRKDVVEQ